MKLTKNMIASLPASEKDTIHWDDAVKGFGVRVKPSGAKTYVFQYRNRFGRSKRTSIGQAGQVTLDEARREASRLKSSVVFGSDPAQEKLDARSGDTLRDLSDRYMKDHCEGRCKQSTLDAHRWLLDKFILPKFGAHKIQELTPADISRFHQALQDTPYNANRALGLLKAMYSKAEHWGLLPHNSSPASAIKPFTERKRQRFLSGEEFKTLFTSLADMESKQIIGTYQAAAVRLLVMTGCRLGEILSLQWSAVDFANRRLLLENHKTDRKGAKAIPLNRAALSVLQNVPRQKDNPYVIAGREPNTHLVNLQKPWKRIRERAGLQDVRLHDLRHSFASAAASAGIPLQIIGGMLGHSSPQTTARYAHLSQDPILRACELVGEHIQNA